MNLHINKEKFDTLMNSNIVGKFIIGSHLYNLNDEKSDKDILVVYHAFKNQLVNSFTNHHQFQYKDLENNVDYNFVDSISFIRNLVSGDSTINYELIWTDEMKNSEMSFLYDMRYKFRTYNIIKSYLGFADRDCRLMFKRKDDRDKIKGLHHIYRGLYFAKSIYNNEFKLIDNDLISICKNTKLDDLKNLGNIRTEIKEFRDYINKSFENKNIVRFLSVEDQIKIEENLNDIFKFSDGYIDLSDMYDANENVELTY